MTERDCDELAAEFLRKWPLQIHDAEEEPLFSMEGSEPISSAVVRILIRFWILNQSPPPVPLTDVSKIFDAVITKVGKQDKS